MNTLTKNCDYEKVQNGKKSPLRIDELVKYLKFPKSVIPTFVYYIWKITIDSL